MADLITEVNTQATDPRVRAAMLMGSFLEGGSASGPWSCGDGGYSCGPFQINRAVHTSVTYAQANDPAFAVKYMLPEYSKCAGQIGGNDASALAQIVRCAERPANAYPADRVSAAYNQTVSLNGGSPVADSSGKPQCRSIAGISTLPDGSCIWPSPAGAGPSSPLDLLGNVGGIIAAFRDPQTWVRIALFIAGAVAIMGGVHSITGLSAVAAV